MSQPRGNSRPTPRRVQVYYFEKKPSAPPRLESEPSPELDKTEPGVPLDAAPLRRTYSQDETPLPSVGDGRAEALEYHRGKLAQWLDRPEADRTGLGTAVFGHSLFERGRLREALVAFESLVGQEPDEPFAYSMLGAVHLAQLEHDQALALFEAALQLDPGDPAALVGRAEVRLARGETRLALADLEAAARVDAAGPFGARARALQVRQRGGNR